MVKLGWRKLAKVIEMVAESRGISGPKEYEPRLFKIIFTFYLMDDVIDEV